MARVQTGPLVLDITGKLGSVVLRRTRFGIVAQKNRAPITFQTAPAIQSRQRFAAGVRTWAIMPVYLQAILKALHWTAHAASPGPWMSAWIAYGMSGPWHYPFRTHPAYSLRILDITVVFGKWHIDYYSTQPPAWDFFHAVPFHPLTGPETSHGWRIIKVVGGILETPVLPMPPGSSLLVIPTNPSNLAEIGLGDAHPLP